MNEIREVLRRRAVVMEIGGFRPPDAPAASWFGRVNLGLPGETWPETEGEPMHALAQINLTALPFCPPRLEDLEFLAVFIGPRRLPVDAANGTNWCLRAYPRMADLVPLPVTDTGSHLKPFPMRPHVVEEDFPCWEDVPLELAEDDAEDYHEVFQNVPGFKLGGWPTLVQGEISWGPGNQHPLAPEYVFQIDTTEKGNWTWGHNGVGYFGRGTVAGHRDEWAIQWQCC